METAILFRELQSPEGTFGTLAVGGHKFFTCERPWLNNAPSVSCIPKGNYTVRMTYSPRFRRQMYLLEGTKSRAGIRIHSANLPSQLNGCIALGLAKGSIDGKRAVLLSVSAVRKLEKILQGQPFALEIV